MKLFKKTIFMMWVSVGVLAQNNDVVTPPIYKNDTYQYKKLVDYQLYTKVNVDHKKTPKSYIEYSDITQGDLGDCYFLARIASIAATRPSLIQSFIKEDSRNPGERIFSVSIPFLDKKRSVSVSDEFYFDEDGLYAIYADINFNTKELWPAVLEKSFAAMMGGYPKISGDKVTKSSRQLGFPRYVEDGLLTGAPDKVLDLNKYKGRENEAFKELHDHVVIKRLPAVVNISEYETKKTVMAPGFDMNHSMAVLNVDLSNSKLFIFDPHHEEHVVSFDFSIRNLHIFRLLNLPLTNHAATAVQAFPKPELNLTFKDAPERLCWAPKKEDRRYVAEPLTKKTIEALKYLEEVSKAPRKSIYWPFTWASVARGFKKRLLVTSSSNQAGLLSCQPTFIASVFLDYNPKELVDIILKLYMTGKLKMVDGTEYEVSPEFRQSPVVALDTRFDNDSANYFTIDYMFASLSHITQDGKIDGNYRITNIKKTIRRSINYLKNYVGLKDVGFVYTSPKNILDISKNISDLIKKHNSNIFIGVLLREVDAESTSILPEKINRFVRLRSPIFIGEEGVQYFKTAHGLSLSTEAVETFSTSVVFLASSQGHQDVVYLTENIFKKRVLGYVVGTSDESIFDQETSIEWLKFDKN